jgi:predicted acyl esterase
MSARDPNETMTIERDVPITMDDGLVIRADVYRPKTKDLVPVIMTSGP